MTGGTAVEAVARGRTVIVGAWVVVGVCTFGLLATVLSWLTTAKDSCGTGVVGEGGSIGVPGWSWRPPGPTCAYDVPVPSPPGETGYLQVVTGGDWYLVPTVVLLVTCIALLLVLRRRSS